MNEASKFLTAKLSLIAFFLIWPVFQRLILGVDDAGRIFFAFSIISFLILIQEIKSFLKDPALIILLVLAFYSIGNGVIKDVPKNFWEWMFVLYPVVLMLLVYSSSKTAFKLTLLTATASMIFAVTLMSIIESFSGIQAHAGRLGNIINSNDIGLEAAFTIPLIFYNNITNKKGWPFYIFSTLICLIVIVQSGCRTAFGIAIFVIVLYLFFLTFRSPITRAAFFVILAVLLFSTKIIMNNSLLGERLMQTTTQAEESNYVTGTVWDIMGDRGLQYVETAPYIQENLISGIGLGNWINFSPRKLVLHSEFLVQLCENGIIGFILYLSFLILLIIRVTKRLKEQIRVNSKGIIVYCLHYLVIASIIFTDFFFWTYDRMDILVLYGIILASTLPSNKKFVVKILEKPHEKDS